MLSVLRRVFVCGLQEEQALHQTRDGAACSAVDRWSSRRLWSAGTLVEVSKNGSFLPITGVWNSCDCTTHTILHCIHSISFFLLSTLFIYFHTQHHNTISIQNQQNTTKQQTYTPYSKSPNKKEREREINKQTNKQKNNNKSFLYIITYIRGKTLPSINRRRLGSINSRCCTFTSRYLQEAMDPICFSTHVWRKPVLYYCFLYCFSKKPRHPSKKLYDQRLNKTWINQLIILQCNSVRCLPLLIVNCAGSCFVSSIWQPVWVTSLRRYILHLWSARLHCVF